jgi:hypothetical protein
MRKIEFSSKRIQLDKTNVTIVIVVAVACFVTVFALTTSKILLHQWSYQQHVINKKHDAKEQLLSNIKSRDALVQQYKAFVKSDTNVIGGSSTGAGDRDGDNAKIILDALPSQYDYPALVTSLEKVVRDQSLSLTDVGGSDDEVAQAAVEPSESPVAVEMPFTLGFEGSFDKTQLLFQTLQRSIRPISVQQVTITGSDQKLSVSIDAKTYYQPRKELSIRKEVVR